MPPRARAWGGRDVVDHAAWSLEQLTAALTRLQWSVDFAAPASEVYQKLVGPESYTQWTSAFGDGLCFEGSCQKGQRIRFLTPQGHGVISEVAENRPNEFISIEAYRARVEAG